MTRLSGIWNGFWARSWWLKAPVLVVAGFFALAIIGAAMGDPEEKPAVQAEEASAEASATGAQPTEAPKATNTAVPPAPTAALTLEQRIEKSYRDNRGFMPRASVDGLEVVMLPNGFLRIQTKPTLASEGDTLTVAGANAIVASRAVWTTYPEVSEIFVSVVGDLTNTQTGAKSEGILAATTVRRATGEKFQYDGLKSLASDDNKLFFCGADNYQIHPSVYAALKDKGCLARWGLAK